jgi:hypothetical protein
MSGPETYATAAFLIFVAVVCLHVVLFSLKVSRLERDVGELERRPPENREG